MKVSAIEAGVLTSLAERQLRIAYPNPKPRKKFIVRKRRSVVISMSNPEDCFDVLRHTPAMGG